MRAREYKRGGKRARVQVQTPDFLAGDVILFAGQGDLYSKVSRWLMRGRGEGPTYTVHTAHFIDPSRVLEMDIVGRVKTIEDILNKRSKLDLWKRRGFEVWRCRPLTDRQRAALTRYSLSFVNVKFGFAKFGAHLLDGLIYKIVRRDLFLFRRLDRDNSSPVCSGITASVYDRALRYQFGVPPDCADPDHIHDWVRTHPDEWARIFSLEEYPLGPATRARAHSAA